MNKRIKVLLLVLLILFVGACSNPIDKFTKEVKKEVTNNIKNISKEKVKESIEYINKNYEKKINKKYVYHTLLLRKLSDNGYFEDSNIKRLADASYEYMFRQSKGNKKELKESLDEIYKDLDKEVDEFYSLYQRLAVVDGYLTKSKTKLLVEREEKDFITSKKINKALDYIRDYHNEAFKNNEIIERLSYYSMYLEEIGKKVKKDNDITNLGKEMRKYLQGGTERKLEEVNKLLENVENNREGLIGEFISNN